MKSPTPRNEDADREHTGGVGADKVVLELLEEVVGDGDLGEVAKTGVDTVGDLAAGNDGVDDGTAVLGMGSVGRSVPRPSSRPPQRGPWCTFPGKDPSTKA